MTQNFSNTLPHEKLKDFSSCSKIKSYGNCNCRFIIVFQEKDAFEIQKPTATNKHYQVQRDLELVLLGVSVVAVILSLIIFTMIRY